ncbi:hypothetical protein N7D90_07930 [Pseudomonas fragi]|uniref:hypothetical protein n=1 Tax=Pseudomonas fragi TaxID=296 RepID=UPI0021BF4174|nr:hypothetical protein [Pseudomonas fragi]UXL40866.1 hypothetical protein N7D90_07930 [Pseudomonas fragi]
MAGLSGEMLRASGSDLGLRQILQRVALRFLASGLLGMATLLLAMALPHDPRLRTTPCAKCSRSCGRTGWMSRMPMA